MVGYGSEENHFVVELTYNYGLKTYKRGNDYQVCKGQITQTDQESLYITHAGYDGVFQDQLHSCKARFLVFYRGLLFVHLNPLIESTFFSKVMVACVWKLLEGIPSSCMTRFLQAVVSLVHS